MNSDYQRIEEAIHFLETSFREHPGLKDVADHVGLSEFHFQRLFTRWAGVSPKRFLQFMTVEYAKQLLDESHSVLDATYEAGLSGPARLHDLFVTLEALTPGEYKARGNGLVITYGFHVTPFGEALLAVTARGICGLSFLTDGDRGPALTELKAQWEGSSFVEDSRVTQLVANRVFSRSRKFALPPLHVIVRGTNFQINVWRALLRIPEGNVLASEDVATLVGMPGASRAVAGAVANNSVGYLIPCHRVIRKVGGFGEYRWGSTRKKAILLWEADRKTVAS